ncbi:ImmA/IrrE family metallo-endopeptidase [Cupriavidus agavae]|nr:hypothetical protein [Cupriavidus agavae]
MTFLDILGEDGLHPDEESEADAFARDTLIPPAKYARLAGLPSIGERTIRDFAEQVGVSAGIVLGRLQHDGVVGWQRFNHLKVRYKWDHEVADQP